MCGGVFASVVTQQKGQQFKPQIERYYFCVEFLRVPPLFARGPFNSISWFLHLPPSSHQTSTEL